MMVDSFFCPHCGPENQVFDTVYVSQPTKGPNPKVKPPTNHTVYTTVWQCRKCRNLLCVEIATKATASPKIWDSLSSDSSCKILRTYPEPIRPEAPEHTPANVAKFYVQGLGSFKRHEYDACGAMMRKTLDVATKQLDVKFKNKLLGERIKALRGSGLLTKDMADWADSIRIIGNESAHGENPLPPEEAEAITFFTEMFLTYIFTMPYRVAERRSA